VTKFHAVASDDPGLFQKAPQITALLPQSGGDREQAAAAEPTGAGLDGLADLSVNHWLAE
jgi:hypothetical protein